MTGRRGEQGGRRNNVHTADPRFPGFIGRVQPENANQGAATRHID